MIILELFGLLFIISFFSFPLWIHNNWKTIFNKENRIGMKYYKELEKKAIKNSPIERKEKICTQYQPFQLGEHLYTICNFICDGNCQFKDTKYYKIK